MDRTNIALEVTTFNCSKFGYEEIEYVVPENQTKILQSQLDEINERLKIIQAMMEQQNETDSSKTDRE